MQMFSCAKNMNERKVSSTMKMFCMQANYVCIERSRAMQMFSCSRVVYMKKGIRYEN